jgi:hypothetical protein
VDIPFCGATVSTRCQNGILLFPLSGILSPAGIRPAPGNEPDTDQGCRQTHQKHHNQHQDQPKNLIQEDVMGMLDLSCPRIRWLKRVPNISYSFRKKQEKAISLGILANRD